MHMQSKVIQNLRIRSCDNQSPRSCHSKHSHLHCLQKSQICNMKCKSDSLLCLQKFLSPFNSSRFQVSYLQAIVSAALQIVNGRSRFMPSRLQLGCTAKQCQNACIPSISNVLHIVTHLVVENTVWDACKESLPSKRCVLCKL